jgi:hypothetical protein
MLVRYLPELLQDNENHVMSDWGSSGRRFKSCQPDTGQRHFPTRHRHENAWWGATIGILVVGLILAGIGFPRRRQRK